MTKSRYGMPGPQDRAEFEHNIYLALADFKRKMDSGNRNLIQNAYWATYPHIKRLRFLPNGRPDLTTVNESLRLQSNMMNWMQHLPRPDAPPAQDTESFSG
jgi:hypothetical protein